MSTLLSELTNGPTSTRCRNSLRNSKSRLLNSSIGRTGRMNISSSSAYPQKLSSEFSIPRAMMNVSRHDQRTSQIADSSGSHAEAHRMVQRKTQSMITDAKVYGRGSSFGFCRCKNSVSRDITCGSGPVHSAISGITVLPSIFSDLLAPKPPFNLKETRGLSST